MNAVLTTFALNVDAQRTRTSTGFAKPNARFPTLTPEVINRARGGSITIQTRLSIQSLLITINELKPKRIPEVESKTLMNSKDTGVCGETCSTANAETYGSPMASGYPVHNDKAHMRRCLLSNRESFKSFPRLLPNQTSRPQLTLLRNKKRKGRQSRPSSEKEDDASCQDILQCHSGNDAGDYQDHDQ